MTSHPEPPGLAEIIANHENRLIQLQYDVSLMQERMPMEKWRRVFWWIRAFWLFLLPIVAVIVAFFFGDEPWGRYVVAALLGNLIAEGGSAFLQKVRRGPRPHTDILVDDSRMRS